MMFQMLDLAQQGSLISLGTNFTAFTVDDYNPDDLYRPSTDYILNTLYEPSKKPWDPYLHSYSSHSFMNSRVNILLYISPII